MLEAPGRLLPRPMSLCLAPPRRARLPHRRDRARNRGALRSSSAAKRSTFSARSGTASDLDVERPLLVGGGIGIAPLPYLSEALGRPPAVLGFRSEWHAEAAELVPERPGLRRADPRDGADPGRDATSWRAGPSRCCRRSRALAPTRQLAWEAPMACGYGACYGCAVEIDGELKRLCVEGPVLRAA